MRLTILNYTGKQSNWGCQATSKNLLMLLNKSFKENLSLQTIDLGFSGNILGKIVNKLRYYLAFMVTDNKSITFRLFTFLAQFEGTNIRKIKNCDVLILNGEGSLHGYNSELIKFVHYLSYADLLNKKVYIINHSLQYDNKKAEKYLKILYKHSYINFFRERLSLVNGTSANASKSYVVPDAAFLNYYNDLQKVNLYHPIPHKYILASGSVILKESNHEYFDLLQQLGQYYQTPIIFIASCNVDKQLKPYITTHYNWTYLDNTDLNVEQVQTLIKKSMFFYSGRFHLNILSAISSKVFIPFKSNTIKMEGLLELLSYPMKEIDLDHFDTNLTFQSITQLILNKDKIESQLNQACKKIVETVEYMYQKINML